MNAFVFLCFLSLECIGVERLLSRVTTLNLPEDFTPLDAARLFCFLQITAHDDDMDIV